MGKSAQKSLDTLMREFASDLLDLRRLPCIVNDATSIIAATNIPLLDILTRECAKAFFQNHGKLCTSILASVRPLHQLQRKLFILLL